MEYEKFLVSLYKNGDKTTLPKMFIEVSKEADKCVVKVNLNTDKNAVLFIFADKAYCLSLKKTNEYIFNDDFYYNNDYLFCIKTPNDIFIGERGSISEKALKIEKINKKYDEILIEEKQKKLISKNVICDQIIVRMFGELSTMFFDQTKKQITSLFLTCKRAKELEGEVAFSKFVKAENGKDCFYAGVVYRKGKPYAIGVGSKEELGSVKLNHESAYSLYRDTSSSDNECGIFISYRRSSDGDVVFI